MRVIIMETNGKEAVALDQSGRFVKLRNSGYVVGQEVQIVPEMLIRMSSARSTGRITRIAALAACFCLLFGAVLGFLILNTQSYGYVSVDVNPSIEYRINRFDRVVSVSAANEDGEALLASIGVSNMEGQDIEIALSLTVSELSVQGYLDGEDAGVVISSSAGSEKASVTLNEKLLAYTSREARLEGVEVITAVVSQEIVEEASKLGTTAGKLQLIKSLGENVDVSEWIDKSVSEIRHAAEALDPEWPTAPVAPETETLPSPDVTEPPNESVETDEETATSDSETDTVVETIETETEAEIPEDTTEDTYPEPETTEDETWPETWDDESIDTWPEEWPEPETDDSGNPVWPDRIPAWIKWLWELLFGKNS